MNSMQVSYIVSTQTQPQEQHPSHLRRWHSNSATCATAVEFNLSYMSSIQVSYVGSIQTQLHRQHTNSASYMDSIQVSYTQTQLHE